MKTVAKERRNTAPKELVHRGASQAVAKTKQQIVEASRGGQTEEQENQQIGLETPALPRPHGTKKIKEAKTEPKTRENYIENLQNQQGDIPEAFRNRNTAGMVDIKPELEIETEPVTIPRQGSQALAESQGRNAARKKMVQKRAARNKPTPKRSQRK